MSDPSARVRYTDSAARNPPGVMRDSLEADGDRALQLFYAFLCFLHGQRGVRGARLQVGDIAFERHHRLLLLRRLSHRSLRLGLRLDGHGLALIKALFQLLNLLIAALQLHRSTS